MTQEINKKLEEIFEIVKILSSTLDLDALLKRIGEASEKLTNSEASSIMLLDEDKKHLYFKSATGEKTGILKKILVPIGTGIAGNVALTKTSEIVNDVSKDKRFTGNVDQQSGFKTRSILAVPILVGNNQELIGVAEVLNKKDNSEFNEEDKKLLESLASIAGITILNAKFNEDQRNFFTNIIELLVSAIETVKKKYIGLYWKMAQLATTVARQCGVEPKSEEYKNIYFGTLLHDIGYLSPKLKISMDTAENIVEKAKVEQTHPVIGAEILQKINLLKQVAIIVKHHHENYDGSGFPDGLKEGSIPLGSRIIAVCEFVEELRLNNTETDKIISMLHHYSGKKFDPKIVNFVIEVLQQEYK